MIINSEHPEFENFIRAFWRRIEPYKQAFGKELPGKMPVQFMASMETALLQLTSRSEEGHTTGHLSIENLDEIQKMDLTNIDVGVRVSDDGRFWLCVNGISFLRFKEKK